jgi:hypothetical protein
MGSTGGRCTRRTASRVAAISVALLLSSACASLVGVAQITAETSSDAGSFGEDTGAAGADARASGSGADSALEGGFVDPGSSVDSGPDGAIHCDGGSTMIACGSSCVDIASNAQNCRKCGHDCGESSSCMAGVCQPALLYSGAVSSFEVDSDGIFFSPDLTSTPEIDSCPLAGCALSPAIVASGGPAFFLTGDVVEFYVTSPGGSVKGENLVACPVAGCTASNEYDITASNQVVSLYGVIGSPTALYWGTTNPSGTFLQTCPSPSTTACATHNITTLVPSPHPVVASDTVVYFEATLDAGQALYSCPSNATSCTPTLISAAAGYTQLYAFGTDLYVYAAPSASSPKLWFSKYSSTGTLEGQFIVANEAVGEFAVDGSGIYWTSGSNIEMCPAAGCGSTPVDVALNQNGPQWLRLSGGFVYWVNAGDNTIRRVVEPSP